MGCVRACRPGWLCLAHHRGGIAPPQPASRNKRACQLLGHEHYYVLPLTLHSSAVSMSTAHASPCCRHVLTVEAHGGCKCTRYGYYLATSLGVRAAAVKPLITQAQMVQFLLFIAQARPRFTLHAASLSSVCGSMGAA